MSEPFIGEIRLFAGNFAPQGWAFCDGQLLSISGNDSLFSLIGTIYGGDGQTTFALPDLRGRIPIHAGQGPGLGNYSLGQRSGVETVTLMTNQAPPHSHQLRASGDTAGQRNPQNNLLGKSTNIDLYTGDTADVGLAPAAIGSAGGSQAHSNMMPYLGINFIIALFGIYPSRT